MRKANGKEKTLAAINDPQGPFVNGDLFVWGESTDGVLLADPFFKAGIGQNLINYTDSHGLKTTQAGIHGDAERYRVLPRNFPGHRLQRDQRKFRN